MFLAGLALALPLAFALALPLAFALALALALPLGFCCFFHDAGSRIAYVGRCDQSGMSRGELSSCHGLAKQYAEMNIHMPWL